MTRVEQGRMGRAFGARFSLVLVAAAFLGAAAAGGPASSPAAPVAGPRLVPATAADVLADVRAARGSVVLVNVWATWCVPCRQEFPDLLRLRRELGGRGLCLVLVSADLAGQRPQAEAFLRSSGVDFPTFVKAQGDQEFIDGLESRWSGALPLSVLFDRNGRRVAFWEGGSNYAEMLARVRPLLAGS